MAEAPELYFEAFVQTNDPQQLLRLLGRIGDLKRVKGEFSHNIASAEAKAEALLSTVDLKNTIGDMEDFDFSVLTKNVQQLESIDQADLEGDGQIEARLAFEDFFDERDQIHLTLAELQRRGLQPPKNGFDALRSLDMRARSTAVVQWALSFPRPYFFLYETEALKGLWWWEYQPELTAPTSVPFSERVKAFLFDVKNAFWPANASYGRRLAPFAVALLLMVTAARFWQTALNNTVISIRDGSHTVTLDRKGNLSGFDAGLPPDLSGKLATILKTPSELRLPDETLKQLNPPTGAPVQMGTNPSAAFNLIGPIGQVVESDQPMFRWESLAGASGYEVGVYEYGGTEVSKSISVMGTQWQISAEGVQTGKSRLDRGQTYIWQVTANREGKSIIADKGATHAAIFMVIGQSDGERLAQIRNSFGSPLLLGITYSELGMLDDAEREFRKLQQENPNNSTADKLLESVQKARRTLEH